MRIFVRGGINSYVGNLPFYLQQFWGYEKQTQKYKNNMSYFKKHSLGNCETRSASSQF